MSQVMARSRSCTLARERNATVEGGGCSVQQKNEPIGASDDVSTVAVRLYMVNGGVKEDE